MIASASVAAASGPDTTPSPGTRRGGARAGGSAPPSFENSLRDARSHHERVPARAERRDDGRPAQSRPAAGPDGSPRPDAGSQADSSVRADAPSVPADASATTQANAGRPDDSTTASPSGTAPMESSAVAASGATQPNAAALAVAAGPGDVPVTATSVPIAAATSTTATSVTSVGTGVPAGGVGGIELGQAHGGTGGAVVTALQSSAPSTTAAGAPARSAAPAPVAPALATAAGSMAASSMAAESLPTDAASSSRSHAGAPVTTAAQASAAAGGLSLAVTAEGAASVAVATKATAAIARATSPGAEGTAPQLVAVPTPTGSTPTPVAVSPQVSTAPVSPVPAWVQQAVQTQLSGRLLAAARGGEPGAVQRLTLHLHPADLGSVQVVATLDDGTVSLQLAAANPTTRDALRASLATLRSDLAAAGLDGARLDVSDQAPSSHHGAAHQQGMSSDGSSRHLGSPDAPAARGAAADRRSDLTATQPHPARTHTGEGVDLRL